MRRIVILAFMFLLAFASVDAASLTVSIGTYETTVTKGNQFTVPVTVQLSSGSGSDNVNVKITPSSGLSCSTCTKTILFSSDGSQQTSFTLSADSSGTYTAPFTVTATLSSTSSSSTASDTLTVSEPVSWEMSLTADKTSSISENDEIEITATVSVTSGTLEGVTADLTIPSSLTLSAGADPYSLGDVSGTASASWTVKAGSFSSSIAPSVKIVSTTPSDSKTKTITLSPTTTTTTSSTTTTTSNNPSGPGGAPAGTDIIDSTESKVFPSISANSAETFSIDDSKIELTAITIVPKVNLENVKIEVSSLKSAPSTMNKLNKDAYQYLSISTTNVRDEQIKNAVIKFKVKKSWMSSKGVAKGDVVLYRYHNSQWTELSTSNTGSDSDYEYYEAISPGFSYYAISYKSSSSSGSSTTTTLSSSTTTIGGSTTTLAGNVTSEESQESLKKEAESAEEQATKNSRFWLYVLGLVVIGAIIFLIYKKNTEFDV